MSARYGPITEIAARYDRNVSKIGFRVDPVGDRLDAGERPLGSLVQPLCSLL